ncbi:alpha/beta fold hydrolase [Sphingomonas sp. ASV193]|uniref:S9 family peptidase n=1 Tax=Sphingomonas sp. ASV193 TaxID=3144405 RepID=UPI0032E8A22A
MTEMLAGRSGRIARACRLTVAALAVTTAMSAIAAPLPLPLAAKLFGARPSTSSPDLSPDGDKVVFIAAGTGRANVVRVLDVKSKQITDIIATNANPDQIRYCEFASEDWIVCDVYGEVKFYNAIFTPHRVVAINIRSKTVRQLGAPYNMDTAATPRSNDGQVIAYGQTGPASVLMARNYELDKNRALLVQGNTSAVAVGIDRIMLDSMKVSTLVAADPQLDDVMTDKDGVPRVRGRTQYTNTGKIMGATAFEYRPSGASDWRPLATYDPAQETGSYPVAVDGNQVYLMTKKDGRDILLRQTMDGSSQPVTIASNPNYDIDGVIRLKRGEPVIGYSYTSDAGQAVYFDKDYTDLRAMLGRALPDEPMIDLSSKSRDGSKFLVYAGATDDPGGYYIFDRQAKKLDFVLGYDDALNNVPLATMKRVDIPTADGHVIPGYLTLPAGRAPNGPAIVLPHGGPSARDQLGFDWLSQFLASQGYAVIQPNYRGSAGYGDQFLGENAFKNWKLAISDIGASADYLVKQGIADPNRLAIVGWSYGGYAALQSAVTTPQKYKAVVAIAPVTDLSRLRDDSDDFTNGDLVKDFIGKGQNMRDGSPLQHASLIKAPVLLVHADMDTNVRISHSIRMDRAIKAAGGTSDFFQIKGLNHQLEDNDVRAEMLTKIGQLLERTIGR